MNTVITDTNVEEAAPQFLFYDAECSFCVALAERFRRSLRRRRVELVPLQAPRTAERLGVPPPDLLSEIGKPHAAK